MITVLLVFGVIFVNGWTDAPNAIATAVTTKAIKVKPAVILSAFFNFFGVIVMTHFNSSVAFTIKNMVNFGDNEKNALIALAAALFAVIIWAVAAWAFGIPTSESHALIAGLSGAALVMTGGAGGINFDEWKKVLYGLGASVVFGIISGYAVCRLTEIIFINIGRRKTGRFFDRAQIIGSAAMSFMHGAQDGQKFIGVLLLAASLAGAGVGEAAMLPLMIVCSVIISLGTAAGGKKIIKSVGMDMAKIEKHQGFAADIAAAASLFILSLSGIPVSTTHVKTTAILGTAATGGRKKINIATIKDIALTWVLTFPACGFLGFSATKIILQFV